MPQMSAELDAASIILKAAKRTVVTDLAGPTNHCTDGGVYYSPQKGLENWQLIHCQRTWLQDTFRKMGAVNGQRRNENKKMPKYNLCRTSTDQ
jgi:hypothetical protein